MLSSTLTTERAPCTIHPSANCTQHVVTSSVVSLSEHSDPGALHEEAEKIRTQELVGELLEQKRKRVFEVSMYCLDTTYLRRPERQTETIWKFSSVTGVCVCLQLYQYMKNQPTETEVMQVCSFMPMDHTWCNRERSFKTFLEKSGFLHWIFVCHWPSEFQGHISSPKNYTLPLSWASRFPCLLAFQVSNRMLAAWE